MDDFETLGAIGRGHDLEAVKLQVDPDQLPDDLAVVNDKHPAGHTSHVPKGRAARLAASGFCPFPPPTGPGLLEPVDPGLRRSGRDARRRPARRRGG